VPMAVVGVHDAIFALDTPSRAFGVFMFATALALLVGTTGMLRQRWWKWYGVPLAVVGGLAGGAVAVVWFGQQFYYDPVTWKLAVWLLSGFLSVGTAIALTYEPGFQGLGLFSRIGRGFAAVGAVFLALFQLWYAQEAAPRREQPSLSVTPTLKPLAPRHGMARFLGSIDMENVSDTRLTILTAHFAVTGVALKKEQPYREDQMAKGVQRFPEQLVDRYISFRKVTLLKSSPVIGKNSWLDPDQKFPISFIAYMKQPQTYDLLRLRIVMWLAKTSALSIDFGKENRTSWEYNNARGSGVVVSYPVTESSWVRRVTHRDLRIRLTWQTRPAKPTPGREDAKPANVDLPDLNVWFMSDGKSISKDYEQKLSRLYSLQRQVVIDELAL
jgi:hypothetical protein